MPKTYTCRDVGVDCDWKATAATDDELVAKIQEHARVVHPTVKLTPELWAAVRAAFRDA